MAGNAAWQHTPPRPAAAFAEALRAFVSATPETGFADVYHVWEEMRGRKGYLSLTGNGVNHPNDYGYRLYAATLLNELLPGERLESTVRASVPVAETVLLGGVPDFYAGDSGVLR